MHRQNFVWLVGVFHRAQYPLLFLIFINAFQNCSEFFKFILFADRSTLTCKFNNASNDVISDILTEFYWVNSYRIKLNLDKSNFIIFSYGRNIEIEQILFGNSYIRKTNSTKFLSIVIDINLTLACWLGPSANRPAH